VSGAGHGHAVSGRVGSGMSPSFLPGVSVEES